MTSSAASARAVELTVGSRIEQVVAANLPRVAMVQYAGASGDYNPIHTDEVYAREISGNPTVFAHGMWTMGAVGRLVTDLVGDGTLTTYSGRFLGQLWPGDDLTAVVEVVAVETTGDARTVRIDVVARNQHGNTIFKGEATAKAAL